MRRSILIFLLLVLSPVLLWAGTDVHCPVEAGKPVQEFRQSDMDATGTFTLTNDIVWTLIGRVHVKDGYTLNVEPGTIIKGAGRGEIDPQVDEPSAIIVDRGGYAEFLGDECCPIVMTYLFDDVDDPYDMPHGNASRGLWGGLIVLGKANIGVCDQVPGERERVIEGIDPTYWDYNISFYGCDPDQGRPCNDEDNSGIYRYISIRHGGHEIGEANEINGLTMGAVGNGTEIHHIEIYHNLDDGFEWFGGTVNSHHLVSAFNGDDAFDMDQGFRGYGQFWFAILDGDADNAGEHDGNEDPEDACPFARPDVANVTYMGPGRDNQGASNSQTFNLRDNWGGHYDNSIFVDFPQKAWKIEDLDGTAAANCTGACTGVEDSEKRACAGDLTFYSNFLWDYNGLSGVEACGAAVSQADQDVLSGTTQWINDYAFTGTCNSAWADNCVEDPELMSYPPTKGTGADCRTQGAFTLCPKPSLTSPVLAANGATLYSIPRPVDGPAYPGDNSDPLPPAWFQYVPYAGAFDPTAAGLWTDCWTILDYAGYTGCPKPQQEIRQSDMDATGSLNLTNDTEWVLVGRVHVKDGYTLYVEPGTVFKGAGRGEIDPTVDEPSALIVDRGGYAEMIGTADNPIIMTYLFDDVEDPYDMPHGNASRGLWGGLILLGKANIGICSQVPGERERVIEGIDPTYWDYSISGYGCDPDNGRPCDDNDNSGIYQYISIRHGGHEIGEANEINGLTMGAVGAGTTIDHIEVYHNLDDGFEWFGGTVNTRYLVSAFNGDDAFDYDQGFRGYGMYWFAILDDEGDNCGEHDGNEDPEDACPFARPDITNVTYMGPGRDAETANNAQTLNIRDNAGAHYNNSIFVDFPVKGFKIEDLDPPANPCPGTCVGVEDSEKRMCAGDLTFGGIFMWHYNGLTTDGCQNVVADQNIITGTQAWLNGYIFDNCNGFNVNNCIADPMLCSYPPTVVGTGGDTPCRQLGSGTLNPRPSKTSPVLEANGAQLDPLTRPADAGAYPGDNSDLTKPGWYGKVPWAGAFSPFEDLWTNGWTILHFGGYTCDCACEVAACEAPGDANGSGDIDIDDVVYLIGYIFSGGPAPTPYLFCGDADCSGSYSKGTNDYAPGVDIDDVVYLIGYIFSGGPAPVPCPN